MRFHLTVTRADGTVGVAPIDVSTDPATWTEYDVREVLHKVCEAIGIAVDGALLNADYGPEGFILAIGADGTSGRFGPLAIPEQSVRRYIGRAGYSWFAPRPSDERPN